MRFEVLGPLRVCIADREVAIRAGRERVLLAMLLLRAGGTVPVDQLVDALWPEAPPHSARNQVQACVSRLRKQLAAAGIPGDVIATDPSGYRLRVERERIDIHEFRAHVEKAREKVAQGKSARPATTIARRLGCGAVQHWQISTAPGRSRPPPH